MVAETCGHTKPSCQSIDYVWVFLMDYLKKMNGHSKYWTKFWWSKCLKLKKKKDEMCIVKSEATCFIGIKVHAKQSWIWVCLW